MAKGFNLEIGTPLRRAFAHNDYARPHPLLDALAHGFTAVEVDVFLEGGALLVGHGRRDLAPQRTFDSLYLRPLVDLVTERGQIWADWPLTLLIDVKSEARPTYLALHDILRSHPELFTRHCAGASHLRPVSVMVSGHTDVDLMGSQSQRFATRDGRPGDLGGELSGVTTAISAKFTKLFEWDGDGTMPSRERDALHHLVDRIHSVGRSARFWGTNHHMWPELLSAGVDQIIADDLAALREFLLANGEAHP